VRLSAHQLSIELPSGWDGRIYARPIELAGNRQPLRGAAALPKKAATLHAANFALPKDDGDFGTTATASMPSWGAFLALTEYVPGNGLRAGTGLFASKHLPRELKAVRFSSRALLLARPGQTGLQQFFSHRERPFCLYVVLGSSEQVELALAPLNHLLDSIAINAADPHRDS
jgi:hypothetical protein